jgi:CDP-glucose 4,6-dehydratase
VAETGRSDFMNEFYNGKRVLITGHTGFKGSWLTLWLTMMGAKVLGYALEPNTDPSLFNVLNLHKDIDHVIGDIRDFEKLREAITEFKPEIVFHLAAQPLVRLSYREPRLTYETNVMGTVNLLEAIRQTKSVRAVVNVTSDKCYENKEWVWGYREIDPMGGYDPYSSSKGCSELITAAYRNSYFKNTETAIASARAGNVIGGGDWAEDRLIPDIVRSLSQGKQIIIRNPKATRPWQHVLEPLSGYLLLGKLLYEKGQEFAEAWNFGPSDSSVMAVEEIVKKSIEIWGSGSYVVDSSEQPHEANLLKLDTNKAKQRLGWNSKLSMSKTLEMNLEWYLSYYTKQSMISFTLEQVEFFDDL